MALPVVKAITNLGTISVMAVPLSSETVTPVDDLILHIKTTGTTTTITFTDPGLTPSGSAPVNPAVVMGATEERFLYVPSTLAGSNGLIAIGFSGALTGVTGEWLRA